MKAPHKTLTLYDKLLSGTHAQALGPPLCAEGPRWATEKHILDHWGQFSTDGAAENPVFPHKYA